MQKKVFVLGLCTEGERNSLRACPEKIKVNSVDALRKGREQGADVCWLVSLPSSPSQEFSCPGSHRRKLKEPQAARPRWPLVNDLPVTDTLQSILLGAKFSV